MRPFTVNGLPENPRQLRRDAVVSYRAFVAGIRSNQATLSPDQFLAPEVQAFHQQYDDEWKTIQNAQKVRDRDR